MVRIWPCIIVGRCDVNGCQGGACWWLEPVGVAMCDSCLLAWLHQLAAEAWMYLTVAPVGAEGATQ